MQISQQENQSIMCNFNKEENIVSNKDFQQVQFNTHTKVTLQKLGMVCVLYTCNFDWLTYILPC